MSTGLKIIAATAVACTVAGTARAATVYPFGTAGFSSGIAEHVTIAGPWDWGLYDDASGLYVIATNPSNNTNQVWNDLNSDGVTPAWTLLSSIGSGYTALSVSNSVDWPPVALSSGPIKYCPFPIAGGSWTTLGSNANVSPYIADSIYGRTIAMAERTEPYPTIAYQDTANGYGVTVVRNINGTWTVAGSVNISGGSIGAVDVALDPNSVDANTGYHDPFVVYTDASNHIIVKKLIHFYIFGALVYGWATVGQNSIGTGYNPRIAVSPNASRPWVVYEDLNAVPHAVGCSGSGTSCTWTSFGDLNLNLGVHDSAECDRIVIQEAYGLNYPVVDCVVSRNGGTPQILLRAQAGLGWGDYLGGGNVGLTNATVSAVDMYYSTFWNSLYVAYSDASHSGRLTVKRVDLD